MADTPQGETVTPVAPSNEPGNIPAPVTDNSGADVEAAKREAEQARIRANQLENQLKAFQEKQAEAERRQLEEKEEFKTLYEQTQARLKEIEDSQTAQERAKELTDATEAVFKEYPEGVVELAKTAGLSLTDTSETATTALKEKLDAFKARVGGTPTPSANNPHNPGPQATNREELVKRSNVWEGSPMALASARGDETVIKQYIKDLPAIQRMKEIAQNGA